ncbi:MAG TPA: hypothetical protein VGQ20_15195 [Acidimicrobiales bacterium]|nr:hypothetical protein [Acidimicrobiales bacterium]
MVDRRAGRAQKTRSDRRRAAVQRRRKQVRARVEGARATIRRRRRNRRVFAGAAVFVVVVGVVGAVWLTRDDDGSPNFSLRSDIVSKDADRIAITGDPKSYRVTYKVESYSGEDATVSTEELTIRRPFDGLVVFRNGEPPGSDVDQQYAGTLTSYMFSTGTNAPETSVTKPAPSVGDMRLDATLDDLIATGELQPRETRRVVDRDCTVYRTGEIVQTLTVKDPTDTDYADVCVDDTGLLLEELAVSGGDLVLRVTATDVQLEPEGVTDATFVLPGVATSTDDGTQLVEIPVATTPAAGYWQFSTPPEGYTLKGRYLYRQPASTPESSTSTTTPDTTTTTAAPAPIETYYDVYVNGTRSVIVHQGPTTGEPTVDSAHTKQVDGGALGEAILVSGLLGTTVTAHPADGWFVQVNAVLPGSTSEAIVRTLQKG